MPRRLLPRCSQRRRKTATIGESELAALRQYVANLANKRL